MSDGAIETPIRAAAQSCGPVLLRDGGRLRQDGCAPLRGGSAKSPDAQIFPAIAVAQAQTGRCVAIAAAGAGAIAKFANIPSGRCRIFAFRRPFWAPMTATRAQS